MIKVLFLDSAHPSLAEDLKSAGVQCDEDFTSPVEAILSMIAGYNGIILRSRISIDKGFIDRFVSDDSNKLKFIGRVGAGMEHIDVEYARSKGVICLSSPEGNRQAVAEHALAMLLNLMNNVRKADNEVRRGSWIREQNRGTELQGKCVGLWGYGNTGMAFAKVLSGFGVRILAYDKYKRNISDEYVQESNVNEIFNNADVVSLHLPLTLETAGMANAAFFSEFKKPIYFLNTSRGSIVHTGTLVDNIKTGRIVGAGLDVLEFEDSSFEKFSTKEILGNPDFQFLSQSDKVLLTPHIAGWSYESREKMSRILSEKILALILG